MSQYSAVTDLNNIAVSRDSIFGLFRDISLWGGGGWALATCLAMGKYFYPQWG